MPLSEYALVSVAELKEEVQIQGAGKDLALESIINRVSDEIEAYCRGRQIVTRGASTEFHTISRPDSELLTLDWPIISVTSVHEDTVWPRTYGESFLLTPDTEYEVVKPAGLIRRLDTGFGPTSWATGHRAVRVICTAGYADTAAVPAHIKAVALRYAALIWAEMERDQHGVSGASDTLGNYTRFAPAKLTDDMKRSLAADRRGHGSSGERAA